MLSLKRFMILVMIAMLISLSSCVVIDTAALEIVDVEVNRETLKESYEIGKFNLSDIELLLTDARGHKRTIPLTSNMIENHEIDDLTVPGEHTIIYHYMVFSGSFVILMVYPNDPVDLSQYDLIVFSGQSHMQGYPYLSAPNHTMDPNAIEYFENTKTLASSATANGERIQCINPYTQSPFNCTRPSGATSPTFIDVVDQTFGEHSNIIGSSMVPHFTRAYASYGRQSFVMHIAEGATAISEWMRTDDLKRIQEQSLYEPILSSNNAFNLTHCQDFSGQGENSENETSVQYCQRAYLGDIRNGIMIDKISNGIETFKRDMPNHSIENRIFIWNQGERDASQMVNLNHIEASKALYKDSFLALWQQLKDEFSFDVAVITRLGLWNSLEKDLVIMAAQEELAIEHDDIIIGTRAMSYMPHYTYHEELGHGETSGYWANKDIQDAYAQTRDTYWVGGHNNRHVNDKGNRLIGERTALNVYRKLILDVNPLLEDELIPELSSYVHIPVNSIDFVNRSLHLDVGQSDLLDYTITPKLASLQDIRFESSNPEIATVNANGVVLAVSIGSTTISAVTDNGKVMSTCQVSVSKSQTEDGPDDLLFLDFRSPFDAMNNESYLPSYIELTPGLAVQYDAHQGASLLNPNGITTKSNSGWFLSDSFILDAHETDLLITMAFETFRATNTLFYTSQENAYYGPGVTWLGGMDGNFTGRFENDSINDNAHAWRPNHMETQNQTHAHIYIFTFRLSHQSICDLKAYQYQRNLINGEISLVKSFSAITDSWVFNAAYGNETAVIPYLAFNRLFVSFSSSHTQQTMAWVSFFRLSLGTYDLYEMAPWYQRQ